VALVRAVGAPAASCSGRASASARSAASSGAGPSPSAGNAGVPGAREGDAHRIAVRPTPLEQLSCSVRSYSSPAINKAGFIRNNKAVWIDSSIIGAAWALFAPSGVKVIPPTRVTKFDVRGWSIFGFVPRLILTNVV